MLRPVFWIYTIQIAHKKALAKGKQTLSKGQVVDQLAKVYEQYDDNQGEGLAVLAERSTSPTRARLVEQFKKLYPKATWG